MTTDDTFRLAYRIEEAAKCTGVSIGMIKKLIAAGRLETVKIGRCTLIPASSLRSLINQPLS